MKRWLMCLAAVALLVWPLSVVQARGGAGGGGGAGMRGGMRGDGLGTQQQDRLRLRDGSCLKTGQPAQTQDQTRMMDRTRTQDQDQDQDQEQEQDQEDGNP